MAEKKVPEGLIEAVDRITVALNPEKIYLFGSHAWGSATKDSDIDLFIIVADSLQPPYRRSPEEPLLDTAVYHCQQAAELASHTP